MKGVYNSENERQGGGRRKKRGRMETERVGERERREGEREKREREREEREREKGGEEGRGERERCRTFPLWPEAPYCHSK